MNKAVVAFGLVLFTASALFVPYRVTFADTYDEAVSEALGLGAAAPGVERVWRPLWAPPETGFTDAGELFVMPGRVLDAEVDAGALVAQMALVLVLSLGLAYLIPK